jgi:transcriptional regulator with XRE-family HTH domain
MVQSNIKPVQHGGATPKRAMPLDAHVGDRVRTRRLLLGMSQTELAKAIGITFQQVQKYEKGANRIGASRLQQIADVLQVSISFFFEKWSPSGSASSPSPDAGMRDITRALATADGIELMKAFVKIQEKDVRHRLVQLARAIAGT